MEAEFCIAVCDDIAADKAQIVSATREIMVACGKSCEIDAFDSGKALLSAMQNGRRYDILLLDVMMDQMDGMELARLLRDQGNEASILYVNVNGDTSSPREANSSAQLRAIPTKDRGIVMVAELEVLGKY